MKAAGLQFGGTQAAFVRVAAKGGKVAVLEAALLDGLDAEEEPGAVVTALRVAGVRATRSRLAVPGRDAILRYLHLPELPRWRLKLIMADEVEDVAEKAGEALDSDYRLLPLPIDIRGPGAEDLAVMVALAKEEPLEERIAALGGSGLHVTGGCPASVALFNAWVGTGNLSEETTVLLHVADDAVEIVITRDGYLLFARTLPAPSDARGAALGGELARSVSGTLKFASAQQKLKGLTIGRLELSGPYADDEDLQDRLASALKAEVAVFDPLERADLSALSSEAREELAERGPELALAMGLAVAGSHPRTLDLELVPAPVTAKREFQFRTVWLFAAAAVVLLALGVAVTRAYVSKSAAVAHGRKLANLTVDLEDRLDETEQAEARSRQRVAILNGLAQRTQPGEAGLFLLTVLRRATPARITIQAVQLDEKSLAPAEGDSDSSKARELAFILAGELDDAQGNAATVFGQFERALGAEGRITHAKVTGTPTRKPGAILGFSMGVRLRAAGTGGGEL